jgi:hypothetical protein
MIQLNLAQKGEKFVAVDEKSKSVLFQLTSKRSINWEELEDLEWICEKHGKVKVEVK